MEKFFTYLPSIPLEQAQQQYNKANEIFKNVKWLSLKKKSLDEADQQKLSACLQTLFPLRIIERVREACGKKGDLVDQIGILEDEILEHLRKFNVDIQEIIKNLKGPIDI